MENLATHTTDEAKLAILDQKCRDELLAAGITPLEFEIFRDERSEVPTKVRGALDPLGWGFRRAWRYWVADGPGIPPVYATALHETHGDDVRVSGHCACPSPLEWYKGFAVGMYHVDTAEGLKALADTIKQVAADAKEKSV